MVSTNQIMHKEMKREQIIEILREEAYPEYMIEQTVRKIENFEPEIKDAFELWLSEGIVPKIKFEGYSFKDLVHQYGMKPVGAFITLDWLKRDPQNAVNALKRGVK